MCFFSNAKVPLSETNREERRLRADMAASFQAWILFGALPTTLDRDTILSTLSLGFRHWIMSFLRKFSLFWVYKVIWKGAYESSWDSLRRELLYFT